MTISISTDTSLNTSAPEAARRLLGCVLERHIHDKAVRVRIVETEAYDQTDAASHSYRGETARTRTMFGPPGHLYVYFTYGMHYCCNVVVGAPGVGAAVLIRAVEPLDHLPLLEQRRHRTGAETTNGPAKLCQALGIDLSFNGHNLTQPPLRLILCKPIANSAITRTTRIGIRHATNKLWRYYITDNPYVSHL